MPKLRSSLRLLTELILDGIFTNVEEGVTLLQNILASIVHSDKVSFALPLHPVSTMNIRHNSLFRCIKVHLFSGLVKDVYLPSKGKGSNSLKNCAALSRADWWRKKPSALLETSLWEHLARMVPSLTIAL